MIVAMNVARKSTRKIHLLTTQDTYCWIRGRLDNVAHTSDTSKSLVEEYDVEVTWNNKKGGLQGAVELNDKVRLQLQYKIN